jgi:hypothetical protein
MLGGPGWRPPAAISSPFEEMQNAVMVGQKAAAAGA